MPHDEGRTGADEPGLVAYVAAVASAAPTPGGGSVAAVVGALAAALGEMVVNLTSGRPASAAAEGDLAAARETLGEFRRRLLALAVADERAFAAYQAAGALAKRTPEEKTARTAATQAALRGAAEVPRQVAEACLGLFPVLLALTRTGNKHVLSDAVVAGILAEAAVRSAAVNVRVNARSLRDPDQSADYLRRAADAETAARAAAQAIAAADQR